jgi:hypothetical protein
MSERTIRADGLELATQSFGNPARPAGAPDHGRDGVHAVVTGRILPPARHAGLLRHPLRPAGHLSK